MTLEKLNEHWKTLQSISNDREMLQKLERSIAPHSPILSGMPHALGLSDRTADYAEEILVVREDLERLEAVSQVEEREIIPFIDNITDCRTKLIFRFRFIHGLTWGEVAGLIGNYATEKSVKQICYRYMTNQKGRECA